MILEQNVTLVTTDHCYAGIAVHMHLVTWVYCG